MNIKKIVSAISALAISVSAFATAFAATSVTLDETTVTTTGTVADGVVTLTGGGNSSSDVSTNATIDLGTISEGIVTLTFDWNLGSATGTRGYSLVTVEDDNGNDIFTVQFNGQGQTIDFNGTSMGSFSRNQTKSVTAVINLYTSSVSVSGLNYDDAMRGSFVSDAVENVGQIYFKANAKASWTNTTSISNVAYDVETQEVQYYDYTINYTVDGNAIETVNSADLEGTIITAESVLTVDGTRYYITDDVAPTMTVSNDAAANVLNVPVRAAETYTGSVVTSLGDTIKTYSVIERDSFDYAVSKYLTDENAQVTAVAGVTEFSKTVTPTESGDITVPYTVYDGVAYFAEENVFSDNADQSGSKYSGGNAKRAEDDGMAAFTITEDGVYTIEVVAACRNTNNSSTYNVYKNSVAEENLVASGDAKSYSMNNPYVGTQEGVELVAGDVIILQGDSGQTWVDYVLAVKTADLVVEPELPAAVTASADDAVDFNEDGSDGASLWSATITGTGATFSKIVATVTAGEDIATGEADATTISGDADVSVFVIVNKAKADIASVVLTVE